MRLRRPERNCFNVSGHFNRYTKQLNRKGIAFIWTALLIMFIILLVGLSIDVANIYWTAQKLQNAADAASLAGAISVKTDPNTARINAYNTAYANYANKDHVSLDLNVNNDPNGDIVLGKWFPQTRTFEVVAPGEFANAVKVVAGCGGTSQNEAVDLIFGRLVGVLTSTVSRDSIAFGSGGTGTGLIALDCDGTTGLEIEGGSVIDVSGGEVEGEIQVNCDSCAYPKPAIASSSNSIIGAAQINVVGCYDGPDVNVPIVEGADPVPDPLGCWPNGDCIMPSPPYNPDNDLASAPGVAYEPNDGEVLEPGYYSGGIDIQSINVVFKPGIYVLDGEIKDNVNAKGGLNINGGVICAKRVMFYILGGSVNISGNPQMELTELAPYGVEPDTDFCDQLNFDYPQEYYSDDTLSTYEGMVIYQDPENITPARIIGTSDLSLEGTIYFPFNHVEVGGDGYSVGNQLIANSVWVHTSGEGITINYDGRFHAPGSDSYLVE